MPKAPDLLVVEDVHDLYRSFQAAHGRSTGPGRWVTEPRFLSHRGALERATPDGPSVFEQIEWEGGEVLLLDCLDRNLVVEAAPPNRSVFAGLELLASLRDRQDAGKPIPRTHVYSKTLSSTPLLCAALEEFTRPVELAPGNDRVKEIRRQRRHGVPSTFVPVLQGLYDLEDLRRDLAGVVLGEVPGTIPPVPEGSPVYREVGPTSCLASFHETMRAGVHRSLEPHEWKGWVLDPLPNELKTTDGLRHRVNDAAFETLDLNPDLKPRWRTFLTVLRALARPL